MRRFLIMLFVALIGILCLADFSTAQTKTKINPKLAKQATITLDNARQTALAAVSGNILEQELEKEKGKLVYSFDIQNTNGGITEVQVDAKVGTVVSTKEEPSKHKRAKKSGGR